MVVPMEFERGTLAIRHRGHVSTVSVALSASINAGDYRSGRNGSASAGKEPRAHDYYGHASSHSRRRITSTPVLGKMPLLRGGYPGDE